MAIHIKDFDDLKTKLTEAGDKLVIIDFMATWCGPCKMIGPKLDNMANEMSDSIVVLKVWKKSNRYLDFVLSPTDIEKFLKEAPDSQYVAAKVDVDECEDIAAEYNINSMPTFVFVKNSKKLEEFSGANVDKLTNTILKLK